MSPRPISKILIIALASAMVGGIAVAQQTAPPADKKPASPPDSGVREMPVNTGTSRTAPPGTRPVRPGEVSPTNRAPGAVNVAKGAADEVVDSTPVIRLEPAELDLGEMMPDTPKSGKVKIVNISDKPVTITRAIPSCGCTTPTWPKDPIPPGGSGEMEITLKPGAKAGIPLTKNVTLQIEGHSPVRYTLRGTVPEFVRIAPDIVEAPGSPDRPVSNTVKFTSVDGTPFRLTNVTPPILMAEDAQAAAQTAALEHTVRIDWDKWSSAGRVFRATFATDHPKASSLAVMIRRPIERNSQVDPATSISRTADGSQPVRPAQTGVVFAAQRGDVAEVTRRLAAGDDPNTFDPTSMRTALHWAAKSNNVEIIDALIKGGADVRVVEKMGRGPLALAAESGSTAAIQRLLDAHADVNARDEHGGSPILWAAGLGSPEAVKLLLDAGADANIQDSNGMTPLMWAANVGDPKNVAVLASAPKINLDATDKVSGETALMRAARNGKIEAIKILVERGAAVDSKNQQQMTALLFACQTGNMEAVKIIVGNKADVNVKDARGRNALDLAAARSDPEGKRIAEYLANELKLTGNPPVAGSPAAPAGGAAKGG